MICKISLNVVLRSNVLFVQVSVKFTAESKRDHNCLLVILPKLFHLYVMGKVVINQLVFQVVKSMNIYLCIYFNPIGQGAIRQSPKQKCNYGHFFSTNEAKNLSLKFHLIKKMSFSKGLWLIRKVLVGLIQSCILPA